MSSPNDVFPPFGLELVVAEASLVGTPQHLSRTDKPAWRVEKTGVGKKICKIFGLTVGCPPHFGQRTTQPRQPSRQRFEGRILGVWLNRSREHL